MNQLVPIDNLPISKRVLNALKRNGIKTIKDLSCLSDKDLYILPGISRKSIEEIREALEKYNTEANIEEGAIIENNESNKKENECIIKNVNINVILENIKSFIEATLDEREKLILHNRFLYFQSLQEIGDIFGISRERIRQIENRLIRKVNKYLNFEELFQQDIILVDAEELSKDYLLSLEIFKKICIKFHKMNVLRIQNKVLIVKWKKDKVGKIKKEIKDLLFKIGLPIEIGKIEEILKKHEFYRYFIDIVLEELRAIKKNEKIVYYQKLSKTTIAELILIGTSKPLHFNEVTEIFKDLSGKRISSHQVESLLQKNENIYMVDKGTFFLKEKIYENLGIYLIKLIKDLSYEILKDIGKPSDTIFLLNKLKYYLDLPEIINPYLLKSILKEDKRFISGRKFEIWLKEFRIEKRLEYEDLILGILENSEKSVSISAIQEKLRAIGRDIPYVTINMIFNKSNKIIRVDENLYTSIKKLNINEKDFIFFENVAFNLLEEYQFPLSLDFIAEKIKKENQKYQFINRHILYSIYKGIDEFKIISERLVRLKDFMHDFKNYGDIFEYILEKEGKPLKIKHLLEKYKDLTKDFNFKINSLYNYLYIKKRFSVENGMVFLKSWNKDDFSETLFESKSSLFEKKIEKYLFYKEYSLSSFDPEKEKDKIEEYQKVSKEYKTNEPLEREKILWLKYLVWSRQPIKILKLLNYIDISKLTEEEKNYINSVKVMFD
ncbi:hypothetical protein GWK41_08610 [Persephonella atlantica]|uniref:RNA polymerase sigma-70 domain-containing protein n=1 Tax=Persephonella atlantica TaxID=2699429 RepID=A0ABS1GJP3_9AQUI|nr:DNA-directed RNA polymerase subunit alpha C-terminal domain-containing protein [Persephonella atlantica]MBK3333130.1 hypothetical protein [Persephonella atlantica]